jgi:hypothetical protein
MRIWGDENYVSELDVEVSIVGPGIGEIVCPECNGEPGKYASLIPRSLELQTAWDCKGTGRVFVSL